MTLKLLIMVGGALFLIGSGSVHFASRQKGRTQVGTLETAFMLMGLALFMAGALFISLKSL